MRRTLSLSLVVVVAAAARTGAQDIVISEVLAANGGGLEDEDGDASDWIELQGREPGFVDLDGWHLTDDPANRTKWRFPATTLGPGEFLVVFASGKDRAVAGSELHTSFRLEGGGEYVALVRPDGVSIASQHSPQYPQQFEDVSYGVTHQVTLTPLVAPGAPARLQVPADGADGLAWSDRDHDDAGWTQGSAAIGYDTEEDDPAPELELQNVARGKPALQSSTLGGFAASLGVDGMLGNFTHTLVTDAAPWWEVDLGQAFAIEEIVLRNRGDGCCQSRFRDLTVSIIDMPGGATVWQSALLNPENVLGGGGTGGPPSLVLDLVLLAGLPVEGRAVRVTRTPDPDLSGSSGAGNEGEPSTLSLGEVEVLALAEVESASNLALGGTATQSTTDFGGVPERAIDGSTDGVYGNGSVTHTAGTEKEPYWRVDLGDTYPIERIVIWNRTDCCAERLSNFRLAVLDEALEVVAESDHFTDLSAPAAQSYAVEVLGARGRYVEIRKLGLDSSGTLYLSLAEVQVFEGALTFTELIETDVEGAMLSASPSIYVRIPFEVDDPSAFDFLKLRVRYDDGFVAYLNGREVARRNAPASPAWDSAAAAERPDPEAIAFEEISIADFADHIEPGGNVLALHGLNISRDDGDFLLAPELVGVAITAGAERYFPEPTPGAANSTAPVLGFVADTRFSADRGFYDGPVAVDITTATPGAEIRYTLDSSPPSAATGIPYTGPITVSTTTTLRAAAFLEGFGPSNVDTHTYIFPAHVLAQDGAGFPPTWGGTAADYEMDPEVVNAAAYRDTIAEDITSRLRTVSIVMEPDDLFGPSGIYSNTEGRGRAWERPCSLEVIDPERGESWQFDCGIRIFGFGWRSHSASLKHAFRLFFRREYGDARLDFRFFPEWRVERFNNNIVLRSQGSRSWNDFRPSIENTQYIRDAWARYTARDMGKLTTSSTFVHLYLNGLYWGLYNPVERPDADFMAEHVGGSAEDYDALNARVGNVEVIDGSRARWDALVAMARAGVPTLEAYRSLGDLIDVPDLIDFMLINFYTVNQDWVGSNGNNMRVAGAPSPLGGYRSFVWDMEYSIWEATDNGLNVRSDHSTQSTVYVGLRGNPDFRMDFADRAHRHLFNGGALTPGRTAERWSYLAAEIDRAVVGESARWGDRRREPPYTRDVEWVRERDRLLTSFFPQRTGIFVSQLRAAGLYPALEAPAFSQHGGLVPAGFELLVSAPAGTVYYTLDGADPRLPGGGLAPEAIALAGGTILLDGPTVVKARARAGGDWSALNEAFFYLDIPLRVTEIHYHPAAGEGFFMADELEFVELQNTSGAPLDLNGFRLAGGIDFEFSGGPTVLPAGGVLLVVESLEAFVARYPFLDALIGGEYTGRLENSGDDLRLEGAAGEPILDFRFSDLWYPETDGGGRSLVVVDVLAERELWGEAAGWRPSDALHGSPGRVEAGLAGGLQLAGDLNQDAVLEVADGVALLVHLFSQEGRALPCEGGSIDAGANRVLSDWNADGATDAADALALWNHLFLNGAPPGLGSRCVRIEGCPEVCRL
jgi:hypothetical protein